MQADEIEDLRHHQKDLASQADSLIDAAARLRFFLKKGASLPLPERETEDLIRSLGLFVRSALAYPR